MIFSHLKSSCEIPTNQGLRIQHARGGFFLTHVIENTEHFLVLFAPEQKKFKFKEGDEVNVYLWRENDRGYEFSTTILGLVKEPVALLLLKHQQSMQSVDNPICILKKVELDFQFFPIPFHTKEKVFESIPILHLAGKIVQLGDREFKFILDFGKIKKKIAHLFQKDALIKGVVSFPRIKGKTRDIVDFIARIEPLARQGEMQSPLLKNAKAVLYNGIFTNISDRSRHIILNYIYSIY